MTTMTMTTTMTTMTPRGMSAPPRQVTSTRQAPSPATVGGNGEGKIPIYAVVRKNRSRTIPPSSRIGAIPDDDDRKMAPTTTTTTCPYEAVRPDWATEEEEEKERLNGRRRMRTGRRLDGAKAGEKDNRGEDESYEEEGDYEDIERSEE